MNKTMLSKEEKSIVENAFRKNPDLAWQIVNLTPEEAILVSFELEEKLDQKRKERAY